MGIGYRWTSVVWKWWHFYTLPDGPSNNERFRVLFFAFVFFNHLLIFWTGEYIYDFIDSAVTDKHVIKYNGIEVRYLNELEYINNEVWANVWQVIQLFFLVFAFIHCDDWYDVCKMSQSEIKLWCIRLHSLAHFEVGGIRLICISLLQSDCIARISPKDGSLLGWILLPELRLVLSLLTCSICVGYKPLCYRIDHSSFFFLRRQGLLHSGHGVSWISEFHKFLWLIISHLQNLLSLSWILSLHYRVLMSWMV